MFTFPLAEELKENPRLLLLGAHCDDIEIGCGGTLIRLLRDNPEVAVDWVVFSSNSVRKEEALASANEYLNEQESKNIHILEYRNGYFPTEMDKIKTYFEHLKREVDPTIIFTHCRRDLHQDHRTISELTWNTFRNHLILEYEIPKYDGDLGSPNVFVPLQEDEVNEKIERLCNHYVTQRSRQWFSPETFRAILKIRGIECNSKTGLSEAFYGRKVCMK